MELDIYKNVIRRAYDRSAGETFEVFYARLVESLEIAAELMGGAGFSTNQTTPSLKAFPSKGLIEMPPPSAPAKPRAVLISAAPPVAGADESEENDDDVDHWESKPGKGDGCNKLEAHLKSLLPISITLQLPGFAQPLELSRGVSGPGLKFVYVTYSIPGSQEMGPRYTVMTSRRAESLDKDAILNDIMEQATAMYSSEKRQIVAHVTTSPGMPSAQELDRILQRDRAAQQPNDGVSGDDARQAAENAREWAANRSQRWQ